MVLVYLPPLLLAGGVSDFFGQQRGKIALLSKIGEMGLWHLLRFFST